MDDSLRTLAKQIQQLHDLEAIKGLIARYAIGADRKNDPHIMGPLFAPDAVWECEGFGRFEGRDTIAKALSDVAQQQILWTLHYMVSPSIELAADGNGAEGSWYLWELATVKGAGAEPESVWCGGTYDATFTRRDGAWYFAHVRLNLRLWTAFDRPWGLEPRAP